MSEIASAPAASTARAISVMLVTLGDSLTISGLSGQCCLTMEVMRSAPAHDVPNAAPPAFTLGQEMFSSTMSTSEAFTFSAMSA